MNIGSLWKRETDTKRYWSGVIQSPFLPGGEIRIAIFANENKSSENAPDFSIVWSPEKKKKEGNAPAGDEPGSKGGSADSPFSDSNIPF